MITIENLSKSFGDKPVLENIRLYVPQRKTHVIVGPSGSGKSCLLRCIAGLEPFHAGNISIGGKELPPWRANQAHEREDLRRLRQQVGFVFQQFNLFPHMTAIQNIMEGPVQVLGRNKNEAEDEARALLQSIHLQDKAGRYPNELSGGEQQRIAIARALAMKPRCVLLDEPTSALDPEMVGDVLQVMRELSENGQTLLIVTHEMGFAREVANFVSMLDQGRILETSIPEKLFTDPEKERTRSFLNRVLQR